MSDTDLMKKKPGRPSTRVGEYESIGVQILKTLLADLENSPNSRRSNIEEALKEYISQGKHLISLEVNEEKADDEEDEE